MDGTVVFAAAYAVLTLAGAAGLERLGRADSGRLVLGAPPLAKRSPNEPVAWPGSGSVALHTAVAASATLAATLLAVVVAIGHREPVEFAVLAVVIVLGVRQLRRFALSLFGERGGLLLARVRNGETRQPWT